MSEPTAGPGPRSLDVGGARADELFAVLADPHRRFTLQYLRTVDPPLAVEELASELVAWEASRPPARRSGRDREAIEIALVHHHLPKLADAGLVSFDVADRTVRLGDGPHELAAYLGVAASD